MPSVIKNETDWHSNKVSSSTLYTPPGSLEIYIFQKYHDVHIIFLVQNYRIRALLASPGQRAALTDTQLASMRCYMVLLLMKTNGYQGNVIMEYTALKTQRERNTLNDLEAWGSGNRLWHCPSAASEQQARRGKRGGCASHREMRVPSLFGGDHSVAGVHSSVALPKFLQALRVDELMLLSLRGKKWRNHTGQFLGFWKKNG